MTDERKLCTFMLDNFLFGVDVEQVQEVFRYQEQTRVPLAPEVVVGLINLRGQIVTALDLRRHLQLRERPEGERPVNIVIRTEDAPVSLLVDELGDVVEVTDDLFEPPPETLDGVARNLILGAYKLESRLLLLLDSARIARIDIGNDDPPPSVSTNHERGARDS